MNLLTILIIFFVAVGVGYLIWKFCPQPFKNILLVIIALALTIWFLELVGFIHWLTSRSV